MVTDTISIFIGRFAYGISIGLNSALVPLYIREMSPVELSGRTGAVAMVMIFFGILVSYLFGFGNPSPGSPEFFTSTWWKF
jgi:MFS family permease